MSFPILSKTLLALPLPVVLEQRVLEQSLEQVVSSGGDGVVATETVIEALV